MNKLVVFVGAQGSGKTTQARLLSKTLEYRGKKVHVTSLSYSPLFHCAFIKLAVKASGSNVVKTRFYEDKPAQASPNPKTVAKLLWVADLFQFSSFVLSQVKLAALKPFNKIIIDHEGYVLKQIADFICLAGDAQKATGSKPKKSAGTLTGFLLRSLAKNRVVLFYLKAEHASLRPRYAKRGTAVEPAGYTDFQNSFFENLLSALDGVRSVAVVRVDSNRSAEAVQAQIAASITLIEG
jgi:deoxyadenosine/deoxycytidine kinase